MPISCQFPLMILTAWLHCRRAGLQLAVSGWLGEPPIYKRLYTVDEVSHEGPADTIDITACSADFREEFNVMREVSWHDVTVERVMSTIAHRYGLKVQISRMLMDLEIDHADQTQESDMSFLTRMAEMLGAIATVKNGSLLFILLGGGVTADGKVLPPASIDRTSGDRHRFAVLPIGIRIPAFRLTCWILILVKRKRSV